MLVSVSNVKKSFGPDEILTGVTFRLERGEKVALVGRNGTGKSTLLKLLVGQYEPDEGAIVFQRGAKIAYLKQEMPVTTGRTVLEEAEKGAEERLHLLERLEALSKKLESTEQADLDDLEEYAMLHEHFDEASGFSAERDVRTVLKRLGFTEDEFDKPTDVLSGGEKTRLAIARILLEEPDLLILDEPTNHLDLQATEWLESWVTRYHGAVLLVSHDRTFLDSTAQRVLEMRDGSVAAYPGPFGKYLKLKEEEEARLAEVARRQEMEIAKLDEYVRRFMNSQRTAQARGRLKQMNRLIESKVEAPKGEKGIKGGFGDSKRSGDLVLEAKKLNVGFVDGGEETTLIKELDWTVRIGERWGIIGQNGAGKSTLIKACMGEIEVLDGQVRLGSNVVAGYFTQDASDLDPEQSPLDTLVWDDDMKPADARNLLGRFLIQGDDVYRPIRTLSGGEKNKLSLARLTNLNPNLLVLDEPTNHLDMASREALAEILKEYKGTLLLISHDRWLLSQVADRILDVRKEGVIQYPGGYQDYRDRMMKDTGADSVSAGSSKKIEEARPDEFAEFAGWTPREVSKQLGVRQKELTEAEKAVETAETLLVEIEKKLATPGPKDDVFELSKKHQETQQLIQTRLAEWEECTHRVERLEAFQASFSKA